METTLNALLERRAIKVFDPVAIPAAARQQILDAARLAPSSFNMQPYRFYWVESPDLKKAAVKLCLDQMPATTASALVVAVADIGSLRATAEGQLAWMRQNGFSEKKISEYEFKARIGRWLFAPGWFGSLGALRWAIFRLLHLCKIIGMPPVSRQGLFKWAFKNTSLACENLMIAAEALGFNTCPMDGFDGRRLAKFLGLSSKDHEIVMVIAVGRKSLKHRDQLQWRRPLEATVTFL